jgi:hypothetical protein
MIMNWIDDKFDEREHHKPTPEEHNAETVQQHKRNLALAAKTWNRLIEVVRDDIRRFNARSPVRRAKVSATFECIDVHWDSPLQTALMISRKLNETTANYAAPQKPNERKAHEGTINLLTDSAESVSEKLLAPVLFDSLLSRKTFTVSVQVT